MQANDKYEYFINETNKRLDHMEQRQEARFNEVTAKLDTLIMFRTFLLGGAITLSALVSFAITIVFRR